MDLSKYHYILAIAEYKSISKAAAMCYVSQPALTKCVNKIEAELGVTLFDRSVSPIRVTYAGERYISGIKSILAMKSQLDKEMEVISNRRDSWLTVGIPDTRGVTWLPHLLPPFYEKNPNVHVKIIEGKTRTMERDLLNEEVDVVVVATLPLMTAGIEYETLCDEQLMLVLSSEHPIFNGNPPPFIKNTLHYIDAKQLDGQPFISVSPLQGLYHAAGLMFEQFKIKPRSVLEIINTSTAYTLASEGLGFTIAPVRSAFIEHCAKPPVFCTLSDPPFSRTIVAEYKRDKPLSSFARSFIDSTKHVATTCPELQLPSFGVVYDCAADCAG